MFVDFGGGIVPVVFVVFAFIITLVLGPLIVIFTYLHFRRRAIAKKELETLHNEISRIRLDLADIKDQIAEFIIRTN